MNKPANTVVDLAAFSAQREAASDAGPSAPNPRSAGRPRAAPAALSLPARMRAWEDGTQVFPVVIALGAVIFGLAATKAPEAAMATAAATGGLLVLNHRVKLAMIAAVLGLNLLASEAARLSPEYWAMMALIATALLLRGRLVSAMLQPARWIWVVALALAIICRAAASLSGEREAAFFVVAGLPCAAYLGCGLARHLAMGDARLLSWGEDGLVPVTRDLLLGRITSGMLHDLAQPLNVISMANGNMGYIVDQLDIDPQDKANLADRIARIATHTESAAYILGLFRGFGRDSNRELALLTVRSALERAVAATRSHVRHHGVSVDLRGDALDHLIPAHHGALEMMAVAALLNAFAGYVRGDGSKGKGQVRLIARLTPAFVVVTVQCLDEEGAAVSGPMPDHATLWLVEQVAFAVSGDFRCHHRARKETRFVIRLGRDDI